MEKENDKKYFNIPVPLLKLLFTDSSGFFQNVFDVGIYLHSKTLQGSEKKRYKDACTFFEMKTPIDTWINIANAQGFLGSIPDNYPTTGIGRDMWFDFYRNQKDEFDIACLGVFLAIKSIIGKKTYVKTNKAFIHARMFGYNTAGDRPIPNQLTPIQKKYQMRYHMDKVITELEINWHLKTLWNHNRGFYLSFDLSLEEMARIIEKDKYSTKKRKLQEEKRQAIKKVND